MRQGIWLTVIFSDSCNENVFTSLLLGLIWRIQKTRTPPWWGSANRFCLRAWVHQADLCYCQVVCNYAQTGLQDCPLVDIRKILWAEWSKAVRKLEEQSQKLNPICVLVQDLFSIVTYSLRLLKGWSKRQDLSFHLLLWSFTLRSLLLSCSKCSGISCTFNLHFLASGYPTETTQITQEGCDSVLFSWS